MSSKPTCTKTKDFKAIATFRAYYQLAKPGIIYGNIMTATAGFLFASRLHINLPLLAATLLGISLVIGSACVFNNYIDRDIDSLMSRTMNRALVQGTIHAKQALTYASVLGVAGLSVLIVFTPFLVVIIGLVAFVDYVVLYGWSKRHSEHSTLVGTISGAAPIVAGYVAVRGRIDGAAIVLFIIMVFWQMPHFYAIALYRRLDYATAGIPVLAVKRGTTVTKRQIMLYIVGFAAANVLLTVLGYTAISYLVGMMIASAAWFFIGLRSYRTLTDDRWGRKMFLVSLLVILAFSVLLAIGRLLP